VTTAGSGVCPCTSEDALDVENLALCLYAADGATLVGRVIAEYGYNAAGARTFVRYVDATTGAVVAVPAAGTVRPCGLAMREHDLAVLCDINEATGVVTAFVRDYVRDDTGAVTGRVDYLLDGSAPYAVTGTVRVCGTSADPVASRARRVLAAGPAWTPTNDIPTGVVPMSVTAIGISGTWSVTDSSGTATTNLPAGLSLSWTADTGDRLTPPQSISADSGSAVMVIWTLK
jgi:hypothetical protein